jgi:hypothetical protein
MKSARDWKNRAYDLLVAKTPRREIAEILNREGYARKRFGPFKRESIDNWVHKEKIVVASTADFSLGELPPGAVRRD